MRKVEDALEDRVLSLAADGLKQREIATELGKGLGTINRILQRNR